MENPTVTSVLSLQLGSAITFLFPSESAVNLCPLSNCGKGEAWPGGTLQSKKGSEVFRNEQRKKGISLEDQRLPQIPLCWSIPARTCVQTVRKRDWSRGDEKGGWGKKSLPDREQRTQHEIAQESKLTDVFSLRPTWDKVQQPGSSTIRQFHRSYEGIFSCNNAGDWTLGLTHAKTMMLPV